MKIDLREFFGTVPKRHKTLLDPRQAQVADNAKLWSGKLAAWRALASEYAPKGATPVLSIYKHADAYWFESDDDVDWVRGPVENDGGYVYSTDGVGYPRITSTDLATGGAGAYPHDSRRLGVPAPSNPVTFAENAISGTISDITGQSVGSNGDDITTQVTDRARVTYTVFGVFQSEVAQSGYAVATIRANGEIIKKEKQPLSFARARPGEPQPARFNFSVEKTFKPDADGEFTFSFSFGTEGISSASQIALVEAATVRLDGIVSVTVNEGHGLTVGEMIEIDGAGGMGEFNGQRYTILDIIGDNNLVLASDTEETYSGGGTWTKVYSVEDTEDRAYVFTYLSDFEGLVMEGPQSDPSEVKEIHPELGTTVTFPAAPDAAWNITGVRLYRGVVGSQETTWVLVEEFDSAQPDPFSDTTPAAELGTTVLASTTYNPPPFAMSGLVNLDNGVLVGFSGNTLYPCEPYLPHAYPSSYTKTTAFDIVALAPIGGATLAVLTNGNPYILSGRHPLDFALERIDTAAACLSKRATVDMGYSVVYPADAGLVGLTVGKAAVITRELFTRDEWQALDPESMIAARYDNRYVCFYDAGGGNKGGFVLDPAKPEHSLTWLDFHATAAWTDTRNGELYLVVNDEIGRFDGGAGTLEYTWRSKRFEWPRPGSPAVARVEAESYPVTLKCYMVLDGALTLRWTHEVQDARPFRVKGGVLTEEIELELIGSATVKRVRVAESFDELKADGRGE